MYFIQSKNTVSANGGPKYLNMAGFVLHTEEKEKDVALKIFRFSWLSVFQAIFARLLLIGHNVVAVWRVTVAYENPTYWVMLLTNILIMGEGQHVLLKRNGIEFTWWCPAFFFYLTSTLPTVWLLQLNLQYNYVYSLSGQSSTSPYVPLTGMTDNTNLTVSTLSATINVTNVTASPTTTTGPQLLDKLLDADTWIIFVEQSLVYMLVLCRWLLPRGNVSRDYLSDLLLEFLATASDIMELLAIFAEDKVKGNIPITYTILTIWSLSFIQFIPVLVHKRKYRHIRSPHLAWLYKRCGDYFAEVALTCMSIIVQDGPFLVVRLYVIVGLNVVTYGLAFFVLKNVLTILLLLYRLFVLCIDLPCCYEKESVFLAIDSVDFSKPIELTLPKPNPPKINETFSRIKEVGADTNGVLQSPVT